MNLRREIEECCMQLESNKVNERKKVCDRLSHLLEDEQVITLVTEGDFITWKQIISSMQTCLRKDADKIVEDARKKGNFNTKLPSAELFVQVIKTAVREADDQINVNELVGYIVGCMKDSRMKKCYNTMYLLVLKEYILQNSKCRGRLESEDWSGVFRFLKTMSEESAFETLALKCFMLMIKWGPTSGLPPCLLREEFEFITKLCQMITQNSPLNQQEDVLDIALDFCRHNAKDNRVSCCKLGEDVFYRIIDLYVLNGREAKIKKQLVEFFLLQMTIHQPNGVTQGDACAYAFSWTCWKKCVRRMYTLLSSEINFYFQNHHKNSSFFITRGCSVTLLDTFSTLFVEVSRQLFEGPDLDVSTSADCTLASQGAQKRQRLDISLKTYINNIQETKSWLWIHIVSSIIKVYPELLEMEVYLSLLQVLSTIQIESNDPNVIINIYICLSVMLDVPNVINNVHQVEIDKLWRVIGESTLRAFGLNQHKEATETLLEKLIPKRIIDLETVLQSYTSGVLSISVQSIRTMETVLEHLTFTKSDEPKKELLMNCIINCQNVKNYDYLLHPRTAKFLVNLTLKQWPINGGNNETERQIVDKYSDIKDIYLKCVLEEKVLPPREVVKVELTEKTFIVDFETTRTLVNLIQNYVDSLSLESVEHLLSVIIWLVNIISYMIRYKILIENDVNNSPLLKLVKKIFNYHVLRFQLHENENDREVKGLVNCVGILDKLFMFNDNAFLTSKVKELIPFELLKSLVRILNDLQNEEKRKSELKFDLKKAIIKALSSFSCISSTTLNGNQKNILEVIAEPNYNCTLDSDYILLLTFLTTFKYSKPGVIMDSVFDNILNSVGEVCIARYHCTENVIEILNVLNDLYPHLALTNDENNKITWVSLLNPFYEKRDQYGPEVSLALLNCIGRLCQIDPESNFSRWDDIDIIKFVPEFLCSDHLEIRLKAVETLVVFFQVTAKSKQLRDFHRQEEIFSKMFERHFFGKKVNISGSRVPIGTNKKPKSLQLKFEQICIGFGSFEDIKSSNRLQTFVENKKPCNFGAQILNLVNTNEFVIWNLNCPPFCDIKEVEALQSQPKSLRVFEVTGEITQERRTDEVIARTASVLHTFTSIILCCNSWIEECLFALVKLTYKKNLGSRSVSKILATINEHFCGKSEANCIDKYVEYILEKWLDEAYDISSFPFGLFRCETKFEFYSKYFDICVPLLIITDRKDLITVAQQLGLGEKDIVEKTCPKVYARALCNDIENAGELITNNRIVNYYIEIVGLNGLKQCLIDNLDKLMLCTLSFLTDDKYIYESFEETVIFSSQNLSVRQFKRCLASIELLLCDGSSVASFLTENNLNKLEKILLSLKLNIYNVFTTDDKLKAFHRYTVWINIILDALHSDSSSQFFFIRDTTYTLINLIENHKNNCNFILGICKFLDLFLKNILPKFAGTFEKFLTFTVNSLKNYATEVNSVSDVCIEILRFLIVQNACHLMGAIEKLDNFPQHQKFENIRTVHINIKYGRNGASLEDEIRFFLQHEDLSNRQDSLVHLRITLSKEKDQLRKLYEKLQNIRGFSEDCGESSLHRLICMLAKMSCSTNEQVRFEAIKCLGELGPSNLMTLVLQPEKGVSDIKCTPFELLSGHILSLLCEYIIDVDINLVKNASEALYILLDSKEGKKVAESGLNFGYGPIDKNSFSPYLPERRTIPAASPTVLTDVFKTKINVDTLWCPDDNTCHKKWIVSLVTSLLETFSDNSYLPKLIPICKATPKLCECLLPLIIHLLLYINNKAITYVLSKKINVFFASHWNFTVPKYEPRNSVTLNKKSVKCMLNVVKFVRLQKSYSQSRARPIGELDLNYLRVAKAAEFCAAHFTALLYSELWCQARIQEIQGERQNSEHLVGSTMLDVIYENEEEKVGEALQNILRNAYKAIGDLDALPGCGISFLLKSQFRVEHYKELGNWDQVTHFYEMQVSHGVDAARRDLMESLKKCSLYQLPLLCTNQPGECQYECLWRLGQWNAEEKRPVSSENTLEPEDYEKYRFFALKALHESNEYAFIDAKKSQSLCVIEHLRHTSLESSQNLYPILTQLQALTEMDDFAEAVQSKNFVSVLNKWKLQDELVRKNDFQYIEPVVAQRIVMLTDYLVAHHDNVLKDYLINMTLDFADLAKTEGHFQVATKALGNLQFMSDLSEDVKTKIQLMDAQLSWSINNKLVSRHILNKLCKNENIHLKLRSAALKLSGQYMSETCSESRLIIVSEYFLKSVAIIKDLERTSDDYNSILDTYDKIAQFADKGYQQIMMYMKSDLFQRKIVNMEKAKKTATNIKNQSNKTEDERKAAAIHDRQSSIDEIEIDSTKLERNQFLGLALKYYLSNLTHTDKNNIRIFRVMALCLENKNNQIIANILKQVLPSYKYITMLPQLIPHITETNSDLYSNKVNEIVEKCAIEHPHHTLPLLLSLANSNKDREFSDPKTKTSSNDTRMATANNLIKKLKRRPELGEHINKLQQLSQALIDLAYYKEKEVKTNDRKKEFNIPRSQKITKIQNYDDILLPTYNLPVNKNCNYSNIVGITSFSSVYHPVGGINAPKRITCRGTDGKVRSQLLKGHDDLRQDAVMEQVFTIMNNLLSTNKQTRNLFIRTYKIVPLSMRSGILEWVDDSMPIGAYLVGDAEHNIPSAHQVYRPNDKSPSSCRDIFKRCAGKSAEHKLHTFKAICKDFKPVFHKFFESSFPHPTNWYERRRAYIHSVATTSMCGYILGIGDRHVSNILIDKTTAEVIHIDFGIAFEQGRVLPTPETVPFRLSRDMVDGMGVSGVEGIFRRSCEKTMEVLRQNSQTIITILEVLLYDPLYVWTVTAAEANKRQTDDDNDLRNLSSESEEENTTVNITAERALLRLREKLQGTELGYPASIEHQVGTLIQQAVDPNNLCKLFVGWQPYL